MIDPHVRIDAVHAEYIVVTVRHAAGSRLHNRYPELTKWSVGLRLDVTREVFEHDCRVYSVKVSE